MRRSQSWFGKTLAAAEGSYRIKVYPASGKVTCSDARETKYIHTTARLAYWSLRVVDEEIDRVVTLMVYVDVKTKAVTKGGAGCDGALLRVRRAEVLGEPLA